MLNFGCFTWRDGIQTLSPCIWCSVIRQYLLVFFVPTCKKNISYMHISCILILIVYLYVCLYYVYMFILYYMYVYINVYFYFFIFGTHTHSLTCFCALHAWFFFLALISRQTERGAQRYYSVAGRLVVFRPCACSCGPAFHLVRLGGGAKRYEMTGRDWIFLATFGHFRPFLPLFAHCLALWQTLAEPLPDPPPGVLAQFRCVARAKLEGDRGPVAGVPSGPAGPPACALSPRAIICTKVAHPPGKLPPLTEFSCQIFC